MVGSDHLTSRRVSFDLTCASPIFETASIRLMCFPCCSQMTNLLASAETRDIRSMKDRARNLLADPLST